MEISVERNESSRIGAESAPNGLLKVRLDYSSDDFKKYFYYKFSDIVSADLYLDSMKTKPITDGAIISINEMEAEYTYSFIWLEPRQLLNSVPSFTLTQVNDDGQFGRTATMSLSLSDPQPIGHVPGV